MTSLAVAKLIIDGVLLISLIFVAFRVLNRQQPSSIANLAKLKELESSLKAVVRDADDAGRNLSDELLGRKRDLEKLLSEVEGVEVRFNKSKNSTEDQIENAILIEKRLQSLLVKAAESFNNQEQTFSRLNTERQNNSESQSYKASSYSQPLRAEPPRHVPQSRINPETLSANLLHQYNNMAEPASFSKQIKNQKPLREQIEVERENFLAEKFNSPSSQPRVQQATYSPEPLQSQFSQDSQLAVSPETQIRKDPRLGVLGALGSKESNLF